MRVDVLYRNDPERGLTDPVLEATGRRFALRVYRGHVVSKSAGGWFEPPWPTDVSLSWRRFAPFLAWRWPFTARAGYFGWKLFGVDSDAYKNWLPPAEVFDGSLALVFTFRPFASIKD